jgi:hypothetical protein
LAYPTTSLGRPRCSDSPGSRLKLTTTPRDGGETPGVFEIRADDAQLARYLRIEERELDASGLN